MAENETILGKTPKGKVIISKPALNTTGFKIEFTSGGQLPKDFKGVFTSIKEAQKTVNRYLSTVKDTTKTRRTQTTNNEE